ncbi:signal-transducing adaptor protein 2b [Sardina pilchardus]|uniref:signal-transducing adaptor protein 2b n=1 Tax=Sardina pilchardus TaxID=27697 RepID=UPI002E15DD3C
MATPKRRQKLQLPTSYYEGYLDVRSSKNQASRKLWTCLCGDALFFFNNNKENQYVEKLELSTFISILDDSVPDKNLNTAGLVVHTKNEDIRLTAPSLESRELWKGFILSVKELSVPKSLNLLPGQSHMMKEAVDKEKERRKAHTSSTPPPVPTKYTAGASSPLYLPVVSEMPACFETVSRTEAEILLERNPERGNLLLRPGRDGTSFAITTRQDLNGSMFKHYRVSRKSGGGFYIDVENPIHCATLHAVVSCLVEKTAGALQPFILDEPYEENITFVQANQENGEKSMQSVSPHRKFPFMPEREPSPEADFEENIYLNPSDGLEEEEEEEEEEVLPPRRETLPPQPLPRQPIPPPKTNRPPLVQQHTLPADLKSLSGPGRPALKPPKPLPVAPPRGVIGASTPIMNMQNLALTSELQRKLEQRRAKES